MSRELIRPHDIAALVQNHMRQQPLKGTSKELDFRPVVRLSVPFTGCVWLLSELDEDGILFGLCDLGMGCPELGNVSLQELEELDVRGLRVRQDEQFHARMTLTEYARLANKHSRIVW